MFGGSNSFLEQHFQVTVLVLQFAVAEAEFCDSLWVN